MTTIDALALGFLLGAVPMTLIGTYVGWYYRNRRALLDAQINAEAAAEAMMLCMQAYDPRTLRSLYESATERRLILVRKLDA